MIKNKILLYILIIILTVTILPLCVYAFPTSSANYEKAVDLKILGLLANSPDDFQLNRTPTRLEGAVMLVRLLGMDKQVSRGHYEHPFTDVPGWAGNYVGYMYQNKLTTGIGNSKFGSSDPLTAEQYSTFVLRSLGFRDGVDFTNGSALKKAAEKGLLTASRASALNGRSGFLRDDMAGISYNALSVEMKGSSQTLLDKLVTVDKVVFKPAAAVLGLYTSDLKSELGGMVSGNLPSSNGKTARTKSDLFYLLRNALFNYETSVTINIGSYSGDAAGDFEKTFDRALAAAETVSGVENFVSSWKYLVSGGSLKLNFMYRYSKSEYTRRKSFYTSTINKARDIVAGRIAADMSDYVREKVIHDYIVNNTVFDYKNYQKNTLPFTAHQAYGCLVKGSAVCEGYTGAMKLLCDLSGIECIIVTGKARNNGIYEDHSWNMVRIDGEYCHVDLTGDDPVSNDGTNVLTYCYFNLTDNEMARSASWERRGYPVCGSPRNGYYYRSNNLASSRNDFDKAVLEALGKRSSIIEIKVTDYTQPEYSNLTDVMLKSGNVLKYRYSVNGDFGVIRIFNIQYA